MDQVPEKNEEKIFKSINSFLQMKKKFHILLDQVYCWPIQLQTYPLNDRMASENHQTKCKKKIKMIKMVN